ncbi:homeobox protein slou [Caerostris extrusa]|uniref:Homeobox protein slou n=1 Tax=Caerostris extrusa TaxID=172846 RepID=A0AAV4VZR0_CAEEX|nr:homeobox protein slou [Caerostris extrusa]
MDGGSSSERSNPEVSLGDFDAIGKGKSEMLPVLQAQTPMSHTPFSVDDILDPTKFTGSRTGSRIQERTWHPWQKENLSGSDSDQDSLRGKTPRLNQLNLIQYEKRLLKHATLSCCSNAAGNTETVPP